MVVELDRDPVAFPDGNIVEVGGVVQYCTMRRLIFWSFSGHGLPVIITHPSMVSVLEERAIYQPKSGL